jgi:hypothetical protein
VTTKAADDGLPPAEGHTVPVEQLARRKGVRPVESVGDMAEDGVFESDEELDEFLAHVHSARQADLA